MNGLRESFRWLTHVSAHIFVWMHLDERGSSWKVSGARASRGRRPLSSTMVRGRPLSCRVKGDVHASRRVGSLGARGGRRRSNLAAVHSKVRQRDADTLQVGFVAPSGADRVGRVAAELLDPDALTGWMRCAKKNAVGQIFSARVDLPCACQIKEHSHRADQPQLHSSP